MRNCYKKQLIVATVLYLIAIDVLVLGTLLTMYKKWVVVPRYKTGMYSCNISPPTCATN